MISRRTIRHALTGLILTALIALAFWLPFRTGPSIARAVDPEPFPRHPSSIIWLPFRQPSQPAVATFWLPFRSGNQPGA